MSGFHDRFGRALSLAVAAHLLFLTCFLPGMHTCMSCVAGHGECHESDHHPSTAPSAGRDDEPGLHENGPCLACKLHAQRRSLPTQASSGQVNPLLERQFAPSPSGELPRDRSPAVVLPRAPPSSLL